MDTVIYVVDDDRDVQVSIGWILSSLGWKIRMFDRPSDILSLPIPAHCGCLVVDLQLPEMDGLELLRRLREKGWQLPFVVMSGFGDIPGAVTAMRLGAHDFLEKPISPEQLLQIVTKAVDRDRVRHEKELYLLSIQRRFDRLTPREKQVLELVVQGRLNKQIASDLKVAIKTVESHRSSLTKKMEVDSVAQLVRYVIECRQRMTPRPKMDGVGPRSG